VTSLRRQLAALRQRLRPRKPPYRPKLGNDEFPARHSQVLADFVAAFFLDQPRIRQKIHDVQRQAPRWRDNTLQQVSQWREQGLPVYAVTGSPLDRQFDWRGPQPEATSDDLYRLRAHRFAFAPQLALACHYRPELLPRFDEILEHWISSVTVTEAPWAYRSSLVAIQRLLALSLALAFSAAREDSSDTSTAVVDKLLRMIHGDLDYLSGVAGNSVANNHLLADRFALWYGKYLFPRLLPAGREVEQLEADWLEEFGRQTYASGGGFEHSQHYHEFDTELGLLYLLLRSRAGAPPTGLFLQRLQNAVALQAQLGSAEFPALAFGNATEDPMLPLEPSLRWRRGAWAEVYNWLASGPSSPRPASCQMESAFWLIPDAAPGTADSPAASTGITIPADFPEAGIHCFAHHSSDTRVLFRSGPHSGSNNFFGHAHADLNSLAVSVAGANVLVDGGTYTYRRGSRETVSGTLDWRAYFAGPGAHNGLVLAGLSPLGDFRGDFRPFDNKAFVQTRRLQLDDGIVALESTMHCDNAYHGCRRGILHAEGRFTVVYDVLTPEARALSPHFLFQAASDVLVEGEDASFTLRHPSGAAVRLLTSAGLEHVATLEGSEEPAGGWVSSAYGRLEAAPQLHFAPAASAGNCHAFLLAPPQQPPCNVAIQAASSGELSVEIYLQDDQDRLSLEVPVPR